MKTTFIYGLNDPVTGDCRYVGKADDVRRRFEQHLWWASQRQTHRDCWIHGLLAAGLTPVLEVLQEVPRSDWQLWERTWVSVSKKIGFPLTNHTDGGDGAPGRSLSQAHKEKIRAGVQRTKRTPEYREKVGIQVRGRKHPRNTSGFVGVCLNKPLMKWQARITVRGHHIYLGVFSDLYDAVFVRRLAEAKYFS